VGLIGVAALGGDARPALLVVEVAPHVGQAQDALTQHLTMRADTFTKVGAMLAGEDVDLTLF
jgi:hypothetical protein